MLLPCTHLVCVLVLMIEGNVSSRLTTGGCKNGPIMIKYVFKGDTNQQHATTGVAGVFFVAAIIESDILLLEHKLDKGLHHKNNSFAEVTR